MGAQLELLESGYPAAGGFRFTWWTAREGAAVWIEYRGQWREGVVVWLARKSVSVMLTERSGRTLSVRRAYGDLRPRVVKPKLVAIGKK